VVDGRYAWPLAPRNATNFEGQEMRVLRNAAVAATIVALGTIIATSSAQAAMQTLTVNIDQYGSAVDHTPGEILATVTIADLAGGGVNVDVSLDKAIYFASTGGPHITFAFNLDKSISFNDLTFSNPLKSDFTFGLNKNAGSTFGTFTDGINGTWNGTNNHFAGPIDFDIAGVSVSDFVQNAKNDWAVVDVLGSAGTGEAGGLFGVTTTVTTTSGVPESSTWAMMLIGFAGVGFAGYRKARTARTALSAA
jgi:hypothetical protein